MSKLRGNKLAERIFNMISGTVTVFADEGNNDNEGSKTPPINYEELIAKARKEEKQKLYGEIEGLKSQVKMLTENNNKLLLEKAEAEKSLEQFKADSKNGNDEAVKELEAKIEILKSELETVKKEKEELESNKVDEKVIREKIEAEYEIKDYVKTEKAKYDKVILNHLKDTVTGSTKEEVDESVKKAVEESNKIRADLGIKAVTLESLAEDKKDTDKEGGKKPPAPNPNNDSNNDELLSEEVVKDLDPMRDPKAYAEWRKKAFNK